MSYLRLDEYNVPGHELKIGVSMDIRTSDASGETSSTDEVDKGTKGKDLTVSLVIKFSDAAALKRFIQVSEAKSNGTRKIYTITNQTANTAGVRQVRFAQNVSVQEKDRLRAWDVSFSLKEYLSNPERQEQREVKVAAMAQVSEGTTLVEETITETTTQASTITETTTATTAEETAKANKISQAATSALETLDRVQMLVDVFPPSMSQEVQTPLSTTKGNLKLIEENPTGTDISVKESLLGVKSIMAVTNTWPSELAQDIHGPLKNLETGLDIIDRLPSVTTEEEEEDTVLSGFSTALSTINGILA